MTQKTTDGLGNTQKQGKNQEPNLRDFPDEILSSEGFELKYEQIKSDFE